MSLYQEHVERIEQRSWWGLVLLPLLVSLVVLVLLPSTGLLLAPCRPQGG